MITEDYVSYETAKLLKERGFVSDDCHTAYDENGDFFWYGDYSKDRKGIVDAPTLQTTMKWLREIHNLHIIIGCGYGKELMYFSNIKDTVTNNFLPYDTGYCSTYEETAEKAIKYCLKNLI